MRFTETIVFLETENIVFVVDKIVGNGGSAWTVYFRIIFIDEVIRDTIARATISGKMLKHG